MFEYNVGLATVFFSYIFFCICVKLRFYQSTPISTQYTLHFNTQQVNKIISSEMQINFFFSMKDYYFLRVQGNRLRCE